MTTELAEVAMLGELETVDVPVSGGSLRVGTWGAGPQVVLAAHGLTASHVWFRIIADQLDSPSMLIAPDLRGRGASASISGPFSLSQHADDLAIVLDRLGVTARLAIGQSMGGEVVVLLASRHPDQVRRLLLIDGGLPTAPRDPAVPEPTPTAAIIERLARTYPSVEDYLQRWRSHPALADTWNSYLAEAYEYDLTGEPPELRSRVRPDAIASDRESYSAAEITDALGSLGQPVTLAWAPRGIFNGPVGLYTSQWIERCKATDVPRLRAIQIPGVNHYTILTSTHGSRALTELISQELEAGR